MSSRIYSVAFLRDNQSAFIAEYKGSIKIINWKAGASSGDDFDLTQKCKKVSKFYTKAICLTKDDKYLLVGSDKRV